MGVYGHVFVDGSTFSLCLYFCWFCSLDVLVVVDDNEVLVEQ
jgi:hypothetical protein